MAGAVPRLRVWSGDWFFLGAWILGAVAGYAAAVPGHMTEVQVVVVCAAVMLAIAALAWAVGRFAGRPLPYAPRPGSMGAIGALLITLIAWWVLQLALYPFVAFGWPPVHAVQNLVWYMAGFQLAELVGRAVEHRGRQHSGATVTP